MGKYSLPMCVESDAKYWNNIIGAIKMKCTINSNHVGEVFIILKRDFSQYISSVKRNSVFV